MPVAPPALLQARVDRVRQALAPRQLDALLVTSLANVAYLTGFIASAAAAVLNTDGVTLIGDARYAEQLRNRCEECTFLRPVIVASGASYDETALGILLSLGDARVGVEAAHLTLYRYNFLIAGLTQLSFRGNLISTVGLVESVRVLKDSWEVATLREGAARLSDVAKCILPKALAGRTESDVAAEIDLELRRTGFQRPAFETIVASGPNAARPHARPSTRRIEPGDLVIVDFGGVYGDYCTDLTRTLLTGREGARERRLIEHVIEAQEAAFRSVRPGALPEAVDAAARDVLAAHGLDDAFAHGTGHGLGLEVHEAPRLGPARTGPPEPPLEQGMVMTLEPGAYLPGWGGVRIEDDIVVTVDGAEWLTDVPKVF